MEASDEQKNIIKAINENNVIVDSVAGSGKTTTNIFIAKEYPNKKILLLTFNRKLSDETKERLNKENIKNLEVFTYHGFCCKNYIETHDDKGMLESLNLECKNILDYDIIIIDEAQDVNELYYKFICKILFENSKEYSLCILGDKNQSIYEFMGANNRFLTMGDKVFNFNNKNWIKLKLSTSYRMTKQMANFMNKCVLNEERITSIKEDIKPQYWIMNPYNLTDIVRDLIYRDKIKPEDIKNYFENYSELEKIKKAYLYNEYKIGKKEEEEQEEKRYNIKKSINTRHKKILENRKELEKEFNEEEFYKNMLGEKEEIKEPIIRRSRYELVCDRLDKKEK